MINNNLYNYSDGREIHQNHKAIFVDKWALLRIDNSGRGVIYTFDHNSETVLVIITCYIPNKREYFS